MDDVIVISDEETQRNQAILATLNVDIREIDLQVSRLRSTRANLIRRKEEIEQRIKAKEEKERSATQRWARTDFPWSSRVNEILHNVFRIHSFRPWQLETINVALSNEDCILIMPTGGGKSLCYQLPALISDGITIIVSPLLSLVEDQIYALRNLGVDARSINASTPHQEQNQIFQILDGRNNQNHSSMKILYLTPEKIAKNKKVLSKLQQLYESKRFARLVVDEVHCVSQFGHDFRPDYKFLSIFKRQFTKLPILGLTATATLKVIEDVRKILQIPRCVLFRAPFNRKNLFYEVLHKSDVGKNAFNDLLNCIQQRFDQQSGIVYCFSQKDAEDVCLQLLENNIKAGCYHAGLSATDRSDVHEKWLKNQVHVICATIAFGMGIDKPDVRFVIHHSLSKSIENFYQESGRAGRDDQKSHCILFFRFGDVFRLAPMAFSDRSGHGLKNLYSMISYCLNETECRRKLIAKYFDEVWDSADCNEMCDICSRTSGPLTRRNCREEAAIMIDYIAAHPKPRLTALQLIDKVSIKTLVKIDVQRLILQLIIDGYLKEDFRFTSYTTICYVTRGPKANNIHNANCHIELELLETTKRQASKKTTSQESRPKTPRAKKTTGKRKKRTLEDEEDVDEEQQDENRPVSKEKLVDTAEYGSRKRPRARKRIIDDDDDE